MGFPFVKCLDPKMIRNPYTKERMIVNCGKCEACLLQKSSMSTLKVKLESKSHKYSYFSTLTYSNENVPRMFPIISETPNEDGTFTFNFVDDTPTRYFKYVNHKGKLCKKSLGSLHDYQDAEVLAECNYTPLQWQNLQEKLHLPFVPYLSKRDAQLFIKRLRKLIKKLTGENIRYYICGEYGPRTYRPHFHVLLWFEKEETATLLESAINKVWQFGNTRTEKCRGDASSYVAGYVNSYCNLPSIFKTSKTQPFAAHSFFLGEKIFQAAKEEVYSMRPQDFVKRCVGLDGINTEFSLWRNVTAYFYPRCPQYYALSIDERLKSYRTYEAIRSWCGETSPYKQARIILDSVFDPKVPLCQDVMYLIKKYSINYSTKDYAYETILRQIYLELRISKHFLEFVCSSDNCYYEQRLNVQMIDSFYSAVENMNLSEQLTQQEELLFSGGGTIDDIVFMYHNLPYDFVRFSKLPIVRQFKEAAIKKARDAVKHKALNDANLIFEIAY